ncbi:uncharacterized protein ACOB8E_003429 isoform 3-T3 [Sarcophilus harrisii]
MDNFLCVSVYVSLSLFLPLSGMGESETDSLLQPSAESNVATSVSKNATGASKDASGVIKHEPDEPEFLRKHKEIMRKQNGENMERLTGTMQKEMKRTERTLYTATEILCCTQL